MSYAPRKLCAVGKNCCIEVFWCDALPPPVDDPLCSPPDPAALDFWLSSVLVDEFSALWECTITVVTPTDGGAALTLACLDGDVVVEPAPVLTLAAHPAPDLAALAVGAVVTLEYTQFGWAGSQRMFRLSTGTTLLAGAVSGDWEIEPFAPFGLEDGALTCEPECGFCSMIDHQSARVTLDGLSADIPARTHAQLGAYDVWVAAHYSPVSAVECTDTSGGYTLIGVVRR